MRKSSLGRRSSTHIPVRNPSLGSSSGQRVCSGEKRPRSQLKQPGFSSQLQYRRSQSEDRESYGGPSLTSNMVRSNTAGTLPSRGLSSMTPITPKTSVNSNLPTGSARAPRSSTMSTESNRRMSSFGGTKNVRKDTRPLSEKAFQQVAQTKVQKYFDMYGTDIIGPGNSIRPMNTKLFVDMMDHLLKNFDNRIVITKSNYLEELPTLLKKLGYRSKVDRSWLMTVNTPHSWHHVVGVLSWLVEAVECMNAVDPFEMMFGNDLADPRDDESSDDDDDIIIDKEFITYLKKTYRQICHDDPSNEEMFQQMDLELIEKQIVNEKCTDEDFEVIQRQIDLVKNELQKEIERKDLHLEAFEKLQEKHSALKTDAITTEHFIKESEQFTENTVMRLSTLEQEIEATKTVLNKKKEELDKLQDKVNCQKISMEEKEKLTKEKHDLHRMIQAYENGIREYEKSAFTVDLKCAEAQRKLEKLIVEYNKVVAEKVVEEPRLKDVEVKFTLLNNIDDPSTEAVNNCLKSIKNEYKNELLSLESKKNELESILWRLKQDEKETEEEIAKVTSLLEGIECDLEKQEELIAKESQKLKEERNRWERMAKEITEEISQFDSAKLEEKKIELVKIKHDWVLLQKRTKQLMEEEMKITREGVAKVKDAIKKANEVAQRFKEKHL